MPRDLLTLFQPGHELKYGLQIAEREPDSARVKSVSCRFCIKFGRESKPNAKRKKTANTMYWVFPFRADNIRRHHETCHPHRWEQYSASNDEGKRAFFEAGPNYVNTMLAHFERDEPFQLEVKGTIVDEIIGGLLFNPVDVDAQSTRAKALSIFTPSQNSNGYNVHVSSPKLFQLLVGYVSNGDSFRSAAANVRTTQSVLKIGCLRGVTDARCASYIRAVCAASLDRIHHLLKTCWAYSLALDVGSVQGTSYLDIRVRFHTVCGNLVNMHLIAVPLFINKTSQTLFEVCQRVMDAVDDQWRSKLLSVGTDGEPTMTGHLSGLQTRLDRATRFSLTRVWCGLHQLDLVAQAEYRRLGDERFVGKLTKLLSWLRRQYTMIAQMRSTCPKFVSTRWLSMYKVTSWLAANRTRVCNEIKEKTPDEAPDNKWWVMLLSLNAVATILASTCQSLQGLTTLLQQQAAQLSDLRVRLSDTVKVEGPLPPERIQQLVLSSEHGIRASCAVKLADVRAFINDQGQIAIDALASLDPDDADETIRSIAELFAGLVGGIATIVATRSQTNQPRSDEDIPPVLPHQLMKVRTSAVCGLVSRHKSRLKEAGWTAEEVAQVEIDHQQLLLDISLNTVLKTKLEACSDSTTQFKEGWQVFEGRYRVLQRFCGALATTFPNTASVESDFSVIGWERDEYRQSLTDFSLEGILHSKQFTQLNELAIADS